MAAYTTIDDPEAYFQVITWNGNAGTNAITTGFRPRLLIIKNMDAGNDWYMYDAFTNGNTADSLGVRLDDAGGGNQAYAADSTRNIALNATDFTMSGGHTLVNANTKKYLYMAFA